MLSAPVYSPERRWPHLWPLILAAAAFTLGLVTLDFLADRRLARHAVQLAAWNLPENSRGIALQRQLVQLPDCLMVYGSSELSNFQPTRADRFFRRHPTGFLPVVIGQPGDRCLLILQELTALGRSARGHKFAVFLSPNWFVAPPDDDALAHRRRQFARDFSPVQASALLFDGRLDPPLKAQIVRRLLENQSLIARTSPVLAGVLHAVGGPAGWQTDACQLLWPLVAGQAVVWRWQDHWQAAGETVHRHASGSVDEGSGPGPDWTGLRQKIDNALSRRGLVTPYSFDLPSVDRPAFLSQADPLRLYPHGDAEFLARLKASPEWTDLGLLLRTIHRIGARVLVVGQPFNGSVYDACGVSATARERYYERVREMATTPGVTLDDFASREDDHAFFSDLLHPGARAWLDYDQALDVFYHAPD